jgi:protocatechuate 3,4-dioxygenase beta subunit
MAKLSRRNVLAVGAVTGVLGARAAEAQAEAREPLPLTPQVTEGPYYLAGAPVRADIGEGLPGVPVELRFEVRDALGAPLAGARVDVWHCDAKGRYSGFGAAPGEPPDAALKAARFLRGVQPTDAEGVAVLRTVYPGWYMGRTAHIHFKVWWDAVAVLTCQTFLPDALNEFLYTQSADYSRDQARDTLNRDDGIAQGAGPLALGAVKDAGDRYVVVQAVVVDKAARPLPVGPGPGGPGFGPPPPGMRPPPGFDGRLGPPPGGPFGPPHHPALTGEARVAALLPAAKRKA